MKNKINPLKPKDILQIKRLNRIWRNFITLKTNADFKVAFEYVSGKIPDEFLGKKFRVIRIFTDGSKIVFKKNKNSF